MQNKYVKNSTTSVEVILLEANDSRHSRLYLSIMFKILKLLSVICLILHDIIAPDVVLVLRP